MKIAVMGSGGVGGYYGGLLVRAGQDVTLIARGAHLAALREKGLQVKSVHDDFIIAPVQATDVPAEVGPVDLVMVCVKTPGTEQAAEAIKPMVGTNTVVMSLQNGVDAAERIGVIVGMERMVGGATWISSALEAPGVIRQISQFRRIVLGELVGGVTERVRAIADVLASTGATVEVADNMMEVLWTKFVFVAPISGIGSLTRLELGEYRAVPETRGLLLGLMRDVEAIARASGVALDRDVVEEALALFDRVVPSVKPSMQRDVEAGRRSELESLIGVISRRGRELGVPTSTADMVYAALLPAELKTRGRSRI
jgi:2-dehydropantoate 2-reductase